MIASTTLPIGVMRNIETDREVCDLESGDYVVMVTDGSTGCADGRRAGQNYVYYSEHDYCKSNRVCKKHSKWTGAEIFGRQCHWDDMTIIVTGLWSVRDGAALV